jgi:hypothetical protein
MHKPIVTLNDGEPRTLDCFTVELLAYLVTAGFSGDEVERGKKDIEQTGRTVFESKTISDAVIEEYLAGLGKNPT